MSGNQSNLNSGINIGNTGTPVNVGKVFETQIEVVSQKLGLQKDTVERAKQWSTEKLGAIRPWRTFFNYSGLRRPKSFEEARVRATRNLAYYQSNYMLIFFLLTLYLILTNMMLLISMVIVAVVYYYAFLRGETQYRIFGVTVNRGQAYGMFILLVVVLMYFSSVGSSLGWLVILSSVLIFGHAALLEEIDIAAEFV